MPISTGIAGLHRHFFMRACPVFRGRRRGCSIAKCAPPSTLAWKRSISLRDSSATGFTGDADAKFRGAADEFSRPAVGAFSADAER